MNKNSTKELTKSLPSYLVDQLERHPYGEFIIARASNIAIKKRGMAQIEETDIEQALDEFDNTGRKSPAGFLYAFGGAIFSIGVGSLITALYFVDYHYSAGQLLPFVILSICGFLLLLEAFFAE